jgi:hypothetical protein
MRHTHRYALSAAGLCAALLLAHGTAHADPPDTATRSVYRIEVSVTGLDASAHPTPATYTLVMMENQAGAISSGTNVPLSVGSTALPGAPLGPRQDVGLSLHLTYNLRGAVVLLTGEVEFSSVEPNTPGGAAVIHRVRVAGTTAVTPGHPALLGSVFDLVTHRRYEVTVAAQRIL